MNSPSIFPPIDDIEPTRKTLHLYTHAIGVLPRVHAIPHPKWWHISLKLRPDGLVTDNMPLPEGGNFGFKLDLRNHQAVLQTSGGKSQAFSLREGLTGTEFGEQILGATAKLGLTGDYGREKFESDEPRVYDPDAAERLFTALVTADYAFNKHRAGLSGEVSPVQLWPHGFDLAFDWFGTRQVEYEENGKVEHYPSQLNLGFYPGEPAPYFYSNPWPFEKEALLNKELPSKARWFTESWEGSMLPYAELAKQDDPVEKLLAYAKAVYDISSPTLMA